MRLGKILGIVSTLLAMISLLLPVASAIPVVGRGVTFTFGQASYSGSNSTSVPLEISNHDFLPIDSIFLT